MTGGAEASPRRGRSARAGGGSRAAEGSGGGGGAAERPTGVLPSPLHVHRAGETGLLAEYPDTAAVLAAAEAVRTVSPAHLRDLVPAERTLLLRGTEPVDVRRMASLLETLPRTEPGGPAGAEASVDIVYDGEDLSAVAELLGMSTDALIGAHSGATWTVAFGGFAPGFPYLVAEDPHGTTGASALGRAATVGPPWEVPRRAEPRTAVPAGAVGLASRYCGIYPRPSPGGWQLIGRSDAPLFDVHREPPALLSPGTRVRFAPQRATSRPSAATAAALARAAREAAAVPARLGLRAGTASGASARPALEVLSPGPLTLIEDAGRPGRAAIGVSSSGAFDLGALQRANRAVGNPGGAAALETLLGPLALRAAAPTVVAVSGARAPVRIGRGDEEVGDMELPADAARERALALDPGDRIEVGPIADGLRLVLAVRGGVTQIRRAGPTGDGDAGAASDGARARDDAARSDGAAAISGAAQRAGAAAGDGVAQGAGADSGVVQGPDGNELLEVLGARSRDTLSGLGPDPLRAGDLLLVGPERGLDAVPVVVAPAGTTAGTARSGEDPEEGPAVDPVGEPAAGRVEHPAEQPAGEPAEGPHGDALGIPMLIGPRAELLGDEAVAALRRTVWTVRPDSDRVGVRLGGTALPVPEGAASVPSEPMQPGAVQVPPSGLPVVFGPDHPTTGGYPVIAVVTRRGLDRLAQAGPGTGLRFVDADEG